MRPAEGTHVRKVTLDLKYSFLKIYNVCNLLIKNDMVEAAGVELITMLTTRKLLILRSATTAKKAPLPDPLYVYCTKIRFAPETR